MKKKPSNGSPSLPRALTGIAGLDDVTCGGLPAGRPTLLCGSAGSGKTMLAVEFLVHGATQYDEPGVFVMFEENAAELTANVRSLGFDLAKLSAKKKIVLDHVHIERSEIEEAGEFDLEGLFIRLGHAIDLIGAKRIVLDTIEALFAGLTNHAVLRAELRRLFRWLKDRGMTAIITAERGEGSMITRYGLEEYVADCVIVLDHRVDAQISTRRLRVLKYRGAAHGMNEYPFLIGSRGISLLPITSLKLDHRVSTQRVATGIARLDEMLGGHGVFRGSSVFVSGPPGTGKSSIAASFIETACRRGERALLFSYEELTMQIERNMRSVGINLAPWVKKGLLAMHSSRPTLHGLEQHLVMMHDLVRTFRPAVVAVDPISNLTMADDDADMRLTLMRLIDFFKTNGITAIFTALTRDGASTAADTQSDISSLMDTWLALDNTALAGEHSRTIFVRKSRGMSHSNQVRGFVLSSQGIGVADTQLGADRVSAGGAYTAHARAAATLRGEDYRHALRQLASKRRVIEAQIVALENEAQAEAEGLRLVNARERFPVQAARHASESTGRRHGNGADTSNGRR